MKYLSASIIMGAALAASCASSNGSFTLNQPSDTLTIVNINHAPKYAILPIEEEQPEAQVMLNGTPMDVRLAVNKVDYTVPFPLHAGAEHDSLVIKNLARNAVAWKHIELADTFDTANREKFRPIYHHTPAYGWMNDANGLVYKDGEYHLYFQYNPYGSKWGNMHWGHSVSKDLVHWTHEQPAIARDTMGHIFSGSCVVDHNNTAGFGKDAIIAFYTSHKGLPDNHQRQQQCIAYSLDNGRTYTKYDGNPVVTPFDGLENFRDPKVFWYAPQNKWVMIVSADKNMRFYESKDLKKWSYMSEWGAGYGPQPNQFECPDFFEMAVDGNAQHKKWVMIVNINPGFVYGGSGTMYFVGQFDGHKFTCDTAPNDVKWLDWGKDHYATVTYSNTPGRIIAMPWMSNWQYANQVPTKQYRSGNSIPRDLDLYEYEGNTYCGVTPSPELKAARPKKSTKTLSESCEMVVTLKGNATITLFNELGEKVVMTYDDKIRTFSMDRTKSGQKDFSDDFAALTTAPVHGKMTQLRLFIDRSSIEAFDAEGRMAMTNLVFPTKPYNKVSIKGKGKYVVYNLK